MAPDMTMTVPHVLNEMLFTVPPEDWDGDPRQRPAWIQIHQGCSHLGDSWQWPSHKPFTWRWHHRDLLGFHSARIVLDPQ